MKFFYFHTEKTLKSGNKQTNKQNPLYSWPFNISTHYICFFGGGVFFFANILLRNHQFSKNIKTDVYSQKYLPVVNNIAKLPSGCMEGPLSGAYHPQPHPPFTSLKWLLPDVLIALCFVLGFFNLSAKSWRWVPDLAWATEESRQGNGTVCLARAQPRSTEANISISTSAALWVR